jgi:Lipase/Putative Ig domain/Calx-beta domain/Peptidase M10 serralysin C terminal
MGWLSGIEGVLSSYYDYKEKQKELITQEVRTLDKQGRANLALKDPELIQFAKDNNLTLDQVWRDDKGVIYKILEVPIRDDKVMNVYVSKDFDPTKETVVLVHGYKVKNLSEWMLQIGYQYKQVDNKNVILVDWSELGRELIYLAPAKDTKLVGQTLAQTFHNLGIDPNMMTVIGHSLGSQIAGVMGETFKNQYNQTLNKIISLDPANPQFENQFLWWGGNSSTTDRLDSTDAKNVLVIHSDYEGLLHLGYANNAGTQGSGIDKNGNPLNAQDIYLTKEMLNYYSGIDHSDAPSFAVDFVLNGNGRTVQQFYLDLQDKLLKNPNLKQGGTLTEGKAFKLSFQDTTNTSDRTTYKVTLENGASLPSWITFDPSTYSISGTPSNDNVGDINLKVVTVDSQGLSNTSIYQFPVLNANNAPVVNKVIPDQTITETLPFNLTLDTATFKDIDQGDILTYSAKQDNGNPLPSWLTFNTNTRTFSGTPPQTSFGTINIKVTAKDSVGAIAEDTFTLNINQAKPGVIAFNAANYSVNEDGTVINTITLNRSNGSDGAISVTVTPTNGSAIAPNDYKNNPITVNFANGETSKTVTIPIINDTIYEPSETINLTLSNPTNGATLGTQKTSVLTILDNDAKPGVIAFNSANYSVNENGTVIKAITLTRTNGSDGAVSVTVTPTNGSAIAPNDYKNNPITVNFAKGETSKTVTIPIINDTIYELNETINLTLSNPTGGATLGTQKTSVLTIVDNDLANAPKINISNPTIVIEGLNPNAIFAVNLSAASAYPITVNYSTANQTAITGTDYTTSNGTITFAANETSKTITVPILNDNLNESDETFTLTLSNPTNANLGNSKAIATISDTLTANITTILPAQVENLTLTGTGNINATGNTGNNIIIGNSGNNQINGGSGTDISTGGAGSDLYIFQFGQSLSTAPDRITDFALGTDKIDLLTQGGQAMNAPGSFTRAVDSTAINLQDLVNQVFTDANGSLIGNQPLGINSAVLVKATAGTIAGTYLIINDNNSGFQANNDLLINITGLTGTLPPLGNIPVGNVFI